jgi:hypothetical protein
VFTQIRITATEVIPGGRCALAVPLGGQPSASVAVGQCLTVGRQRTISMSVSRVWTFQATTTGRGKYPHGSRLRSRRAPLVEELPSAAEFGQVPHRRGPDNDQVIADFPASALIAGTPGTPQAPLLPPSSLAQGERPVYPGLRPHWKDVVPGIQTSPKGPRRALHTAYSTHGVPSVTAAGSFLPLTD